MLPLYLLYGVTALLSVVIALLCWKKHSLFPNTETGYHVGEAMKSQQAWSKGNAYAGKICLFSGLFFFLLLPFLLFLLHMSKGWLLGIYFFSALVWVLLVVFLPAWRLKSK